MNIRIIKNVELSYARRWYQRAIKITGAYYEGHGHSHETVHVILLRRWTIVINYNYLASA